MTDEKFNEYTQKLFNTVLDLRKEIDNLRIGYNVIHKRFDEIVTIANLNSAEDLRAAIEIEELAKLSLTLCDKAYLLAKGLNNEEIIDVTQQSLLTAQKVLKFANASSLMQTNRQAQGGLINTKPK
jgi:hypothetical protein